MEPQYKPIIQDLEMAIQELKNPSGNPYHAKTFIIRALNTIKQQAP